MSFKRTAGTKDLLAKFLSPLRVLIWLLTLGFGQGLTIQKTAIWQDAYLPSFFWDVDILQQDRVRGVQDLVRCRAGHGDDGQER